MLRRVSIDNVSVTDASDEYGVSRPTYYQAKANFDRERPVSGFCRSGKSGDVLALEPALVLTLIPERRGCMARMEIMSGSERRRR
ncbi:hypothetical protein [Rhizobium leguminosarum]|uniref:hypothetical protein n=1 Tax=Rhizobium leguminosarum TaxID=384 RepID=UPI0021B0CF80|nr:hypothetical protein [Rhizobium leguminosarum]